MITEAGTVATMPNRMTTGSGDVQDHDGPLNLDDVLDAEVAAERAMHEILCNLQAQTGRRVDCVKVDAKSLDVTIYTVDK